MSGTYLLKELDILVKLRTILLLIMLCDLPVFIFLNFFSTIVYNSRIKKQDEGDNEIED